MNVEMTLEEAKKYVIEVLGEEKAALWWAEGNPFFGNLSPNNLLELGREEKLLQWIESSKEELKK